MKYPTLVRPETNRMHCVSWNDWSSQAKIELLHGIRLDTNYYYFPGTWIKDRPGLFTGTGFPQRFADSDGTTIDVYQATTQLTDESNLTISTHVATLLDNVLGPKGYYSVVTANMHTDYGSNYSPHDTVIAAARQRGVPVISAKQMLTWLDTRNASVFSGSKWNGSVLSFSFSSVAVNPTVMLPLVFRGKVLVGLSANGSSVGYSTQTIKGTTYVMAVNPPTGTYAAIYQ